MAMVYVTMLAITHISGADRASIALRRHHCGELLWF